MKIRKENIEALLFDYAEGNLSREEAKALEAFLEKNPQYAALLQAYDREEKLEEPSDIVFEDKEGLFRLASGKKRKSLVLKVPSYAWISAAAAVLLLLVVLLPLSDDDRRQEQVASTTLADKVSQRTCDEKSIGKELVAKNENETPVHENKSAIEKKKSATYFGEKAIEKSDVPQEVKPETGSEEAEREETASEALLAVEEATPTVQEEEKTVIKEYRHEHYTYEERSLASLIKDYTPVEETIAKATETARQKGAEALGKITGFLSKIIDKGRYTTYTEVRRSVNVKS